MVSCGTYICPYCGSELHKYDRVKRMVRYENGRKDYIWIYRSKCSGCGTYHRELPAYILPYIQYSKVTILQSILDPYLWNYPSLDSIARWLARNLQIL